MISESLSSRSRRGSRSKKADKAAEKAMLFQTLERKHRLILLVDQRIQALAYLKQIHTSGGLWMNSVHISHFDIKRYALRSIPANRVLSLYYLSLSLTNLCESVAPFDASGGTCAGPYLQCLLQLLEEFEYHFAGVAMRGMKLVMARQSSCVHPSSGEKAAAAGGLGLGMERSFYSPSPDSSQAKAQAQQSRGAVSGSAEGVASAIDSAAGTGTTTTAADGGAGGARELGLGVDPALSVMAPLRASLFKFHGSMAFEHLLTPHVSHELCYTASLCGLCDALSAVYDILADDDSVWKSAPLFTSATKIDKRLREIFLEPVSKACGDIAEAHASDSFEAVCAGIP